MKLLPHHKLSVALTVFAGAVALYLVLGYLGRRDNPRLRAIDRGLPYAEAVIVAANSPLFFTWGVTASPRVQEIARSSVESRYGDTYQQSKAVLSQLTNDLAEVGLSLRDVANVRAYVVADPEPDFEGWNRAFMEFFGSANNPHKPARTTVGITRLFHSDYLVEVEFVAVFPDGRGPHVSGTRQYERYHRLGRIETSDRWKSYGRPIFPMSTGKATQGGTDYFFSAALRPQPLIPNAPPQFQMFGNIDQQSASLFKQMDAQLAQAGLGYEDVFFMRAIVYPGKDSIARSFANFNKAYETRFNNAKNPNRPTRTVMSAPGFDYKKQSISIEYYAAYPEEKDMLQEDTKQSFGESPSLSSPQPLGPAGTAVAGDAPIAFLAGSISAVNGTMKEQAASALATVKMRAELAGGGLEDLAQIRAYIVSGDAKETDARIADWEALYRETFGSEKAPALTTLPIVSLGRGSLIELEAWAIIKE